MYCFTFEWFRTAIIVRMDLLTFVYCLANVFGRGWRMIMAITNDDAVKVKRMVCVGRQVTHKHFPSFVVEWPDTDHIVLEFCVSVHIEFLCVQLQEGEHILLWNVGFVLFGYWEIRIAHKLFR